MGKKLTGNERSGGGGGFIDAKIIGVGKETYWLPEEGPCVNAKIIGLGKNLETRGDLHKFKDNWMGKKTN